MARAFGKPKNTADTVIRQLKCVRWGLSFGDTVTGTAKAALQNEFAKANRMGKPMLE